MREPKFTMILGLLRLHKTYVPYELKGLNKLTEQHQINVKAIWSKNYSVNKVNVYRLVWARSIVYNKYISLLGIHTLRFNINIHLHSRKQCRAWHQLFRVLLTLKTNRNLLTRSVVVSDMFDYFWCILVISTSDVFLFDFRFKLVIPSSNFVGSLTRYNGFLTYPYASWIRANCCLLVSIWGLSWTNVPIPSLLSQDLGYLCLAFGGFAWTNGYLSLDQQIPFSWTQKQATWTFNWYNERTQMLCNR